MMPAERPVYCVVSLSASEVRKNQLLLHPGWPRGQNPPKRVRVITHDYAGDLRRRLDKELVVKWYAGGDFRRSANERIDQVGTSSENHSIRAVRHPVVEQVQHGP